MWNAFNTTKKRHSFAMKMFAYLIARSYLTIHKQNLRIDELEKKLKE
jgi:hypothetical protein